MVPTLRELALAARGSRADVTQPRVRTLDHASLQLVVLGQRRDSDRSLHPQPLVLDGLPLVGKHRIGPDLIAEGLVPFLGDGETPRKVGRAEISKDLVQDVPNIKVEEQIHVELEVSPALNDRLPSSV